MQRNPGKEQTRKFVSTNVRVGWTKRSAAQQKTQQKNMNTIKQIILQATHQLSSTSDTPRLDAELLLAHCLELSRIQLIIQSEDVVSNAKITQFNDFIDRRGKGEPIAYIVGYKEFWSLKFLVTPDVLIPRPETELLVEKVLQYLPDSSHCTVADLGTGSGAIAIALGHEYPHWQIHATDKSDKALAIAHKNAVRLEINNVNFHLGSWCDALPENQYDAIVSNPPYIAVNDLQLEETVKRYEPSSALISEKKGLMDLQTIIKQSTMVLKEQGYLLLEHGSNQQEALSKLLQTNGFDVLERCNDIADNPRVVVACKNS